MRATWLSRSLAVYFLALYSYSTSASLHDLMLHTVTSDSRVTL